MVSFHDIVDQDARMAEERVAMVFVGWFIESLPFRWLDLRPLLFQLQPSSAFIILIPSAFIILTPSDSRNPLFFRMVTLAVILLNSITIGIQTDRHLVSARVEGIVTRK